VPAVLPGAACDTEFGQGVGPAVQADFTPAGPDAQVVMPTTEEAQVRGGGTTPDAAPAAARLPQPGSGAQTVAITALAALAVMGWLVVLGRRRPARSARPVRLVPAQRIWRSR